MTYDEELAGLAGQVGGRNRRLLGLALKGRVAGRDAETMVDEIVAASGTPPLSAAEVRRAVNKAMKLPVQKRIFAQSKYTLPSSYSFVREMIALSGGLASRNAPPPGLALPFLTPGSRSLCGRRGLLGERVRLVRKARFVS